MELKRNDAFFMGKPKLKSILIRIIPDENTSVNALRTHDIDWIFEASANNFKSLSAIPGISIVRVDVNGYEYLQLNTQSPALRDVRVRQAISYGIDKARLVQTLTFGQMQAATADIPPWLW
ncbi:MAG: ABC transporter substrate-binding protein, partial [Vulcanimicrobiaceae bacterium]